MKATVVFSSFLSHTGTSIRITVATMVICSILYPLIILAAGQIFVPHTANGSLIKNAQAQIIGSEALAQAFTHPEYLWPRPSAANYDASATGGSNLSPTSPELATRAREILARMNVPGDRSIPADLVTASGSGMDPHITLRAAAYQAERIASARKLPVESVLSLLKRHAIRTGGFLTVEQVVNVLRVNLALDKMEE